MTQVKRSSSQHNLSQRIQESNNKCICQICTCGKHRCPHPHIPFKPETTNQNYYKPYQIKAEHAQKCGYKVIESHYEPQLIQSTYRSNFKAHRCPAAQVHQKYAYQPNNSKFYDETEYRDKYIANSIVVQRPVPCSNQYRPSTGKFNTISTYKEEYRQKKSQHEASKRHYAYQPNKLPFYNTTTYGEAYKRYDVEVAPPSSCHGQYTINNARFEAKSSYQDFYKPHQIHKRQCCLIEELPRRPRQCSPDQNHVYFDAKHCSWK